MEPEPQPGPFEDRLEGLPVNVGLAEPMAATGTAKRGPQNTGLSGVMCPSASIALLCTSSASIVAVESFTVRLEESFFGSLIASFPLTSSSDLTTRTVPRTASMSFQVRANSSPCLNRNRSRVGTWRTADLAARPL